MLYRLRPILLALVCLFLVGEGALTHVTHVTRVTARTLTAAARPPLRFEPDGDRFVAEAKDAALVLDSMGAHFFTGSAPVTLRVAGGREVSPVSSDLLPTRVNRLVGDDRTKWKQNVPTFGRVTYPAVRDGVDLVFHGERGQLEYDFVVAPGVDAREVVLEVEGGEATLTSSGALSIGATVHERPRVFQHDDMGREEDIAASYRLIDAQHVAFELAAYDHARPLVIDPVAGYTTFFGGNLAEIGVSVAADPYGNAFFAGATTDWHSLITSPTHFFGPTPNNDMFVVKMSAQGTYLWLTVFGGNGSENVTGMTVDAEGRPLMLFSTFSTDLPTTDDAIQRQIARVDGAPSPQDGFLLKLSVDGALPVFASYLDVGTNDHAIPCGKPGVPLPSTEECFERWLYNDKTGDVVLDGDTIYVSGVAERAWAAEVNQDKGTAPTFYQPGNADTTDPGGAFVAKIEGGAITARRFFGRSDTIARISVTSDDVFLTSQACLNWLSVTAIKPGSFQDDATSTNCDVYLARVDKATFGTLKWGSWLAGDSTDRAERILALSASEVYLAGSTRSSSFPNAAATGAMTPVLEDGFLLRLDTTKTGASSLVYVRAFGGDASDALSGLTRRPGDGHLFVSGSSASMDFPLVRPTSDVAGFVAEVDPTTGARLETWVYDSPVSLDPMVNVAYAPGGPVAMGFSLRTSTGPVTSDPFPNTSNIQPFRGGDVDVYFARIADGTDVPVEPEPEPVDAGAGADSTVPDPVIPDPPPLTLAPMTATVPPRGTLVLTATDGTPPYVFSFVSNPSHGNISSNGLYIAGPRGSVTDHVRVTDAKGAFLTAAIRVTAPITITPPGAALAQKESKTFTAAGGAGAPYTWTATDGTIDAAGLFHAPSSNVVVVLTAIDKLGNKGAANVAIGTALVIAPALPQVEVGQTLKFEAYGGTHVYTFAVTTKHGGKIDASTGVFTAGSTADVKETVAVSDTAGNYNETEVTILPAPYVPPPPSGTANPPPPVTTNLPPPAASSSSSSGSSPTSALPPPPPATDDGCNCRATTSSPSRSGALLFAVGLALAITRRRRK